jgi:hypothetical protein
MGIQLWQIKMVEHPQPYENRTIEDSEERQAALRIGVRTRTLFNNLLYWKRRGTSSGQPDCDSSHCRSWASLAQSRRVHREIQNDGASSTVSVQPRFLGAGPEFASTYRRCNPYLLLELATCCRYQKACDKNVYGVFVNE